ncbi:protein NDUFAF4 homolog [Anabrus simplex]|uniref:protein NDUFAF4 homolog n=1 Tax=Anabrus simplex TaxID=316456 RepID=UPI0034DDAA31
MGKVLSVLQRKANRFNVENRAHKVISREKPTPAPLHPSSKRELDKIERDHPNYLQDLQTKDLKLDERLKDVYVKSQDPLIANPLQSSEDRPLPLNRQPFQEPEFGFIEPTTIPRGRFTLRQAMKFITDYQGDPKVWSAAAIAKDYHLDKDALGKILHYYKTFEVYIPELKDRKGQPLFAQPTEPREQLETKKSDSEKL